MKKASRSGNEISATGRGVEEVTQRLEGGSTTD